MLCNETTSRSTYCFCTNAEFVIDLSTYFIARTLCICCYYPCSVQSGERLSGSLIGEQPSLASVQSGHVWLPLRKQSCGTIFYLLLVAPFVKRDHGVVKSNKAKDTAAKARMNKNGRKRRAGEIRAWSTPLSFQLGAYFEPNVQIAALGKYLLFFFSASQKKCMIDTFSFHILNWFRVVSRPFASGLSVGHLGKQRQQTAEWVTLRYALEQAIIFSIGLEEIEQLPSLALQACIVKCTSTVKVEAQVESDGSVVSSQTRVIVVCGFASESCQKVFYSTRVQLHFRMEQVHLP